MIHLQATQHTLHFRKPAVTSRGALTERVLWLLEISDSETGARGMGEVGVVPGLSIDDLPDLDKRIAHAVDDFNRMCSALGPPDDLHDVLGAFYSRISGLPALEFGVSHAIREMGSELGYLHPDTGIMMSEGLKTHGLIWAESPQGMLAQVRSKVEAGFDVIKIKVGALSWDDDLRLLSQIRSEFPEIELRLDANRAFPRQQTEARLDALAPLKIAFLEEPTSCASLDEYAALIERSPVPLCLDETLLPTVVDWSFEKLLRHLRPPHIVIKPSLLGGSGIIHEMMRICDKLHTQWWINSALEGAVGHSAICLEVALKDPFRTHGLGTGSLYVDNFPSPIRLDGNRLWWRGLPTDA